MSVQKIIYVVFSILLFVVNPLLAVLCSALITAYFKKDFFFTILIVQASFFLGLVNGTKILESDLSTYHHYFKQANGMNLLAYLVEQKNDGFFYGFWFILNRLTNSNFGLTLVVTTAISYFFYFKSIIVYFKEKGRSQYDILFAILLGFLFFEIFSISAHLIRQFFAFSLMLYFVVNYILYKKKYWLVLVASVFSHSMMLVFVPLLFIPFFRKKIHVLKILLGAGIYLLFVALYRPLALYIVEHSQNENLLIYALRRTSAENIVSTGINEVPLTMLIFNAIVAMVIILEIYGLNRKKALHFKNIILFFCLLVLLTSASHPLLSLRFGYFAYSFSVFILPQIFSAKYFSSNGAHIVRIALVFVLAFRFFYKIEHGIWEYLPLNNMVFYTMFNYL